MRKFSQANIQNKLRSPQISGMKDAAESKPNLETGKHTNLSHETIIEPRTDYISKTEKSTVKKESSGHAIKSIILYGTMLILLVYIGFNDIKNTININNKEFNYNINNKFLELNHDVKNFYTKIKDYVSQNIEPSKRAISVKNLQICLDKGFDRIIKKYPYLNAYAIIDQKMLNDNDPQMSKIFKTHDTSSSKNPNIFLENIYQVISENNLSELDRNIVYFKKLNKENIFYIHHLNNKQYLIINFDKNIFEKLYADVDLSLDLNNEYTKNYFLFSYIKNINKIQFSTKISLIQIFKFSLFYMSVLIAMFVAALTRYKSLLEYKKRQSQLQTLNDELGIAQKTQNNHDMQMKHLIDTLQLVPWSASPNMNMFTSIGKQIEKITGMSHKNWKAKGFWISHIHEDDRENFFKAINQVNDNSYVNAEYRIYNHRGETIWIRNMISKKVSTSLNGAIDYSSTSLQGLICDITAEKKVFEALREAKANAETASQMKSNFLASMSHELRTPLNSIIGFSEIIHATSNMQESNSNISEYSNNILLSAKHLLHLINDILDYSKIEAGAFEVNTDLNVLYEIFDSCKILLETRAKQAGIELLVKSPPDNLCVKVDAVRIKQVIINLISNAIKFNKPGGKVALSCHVDKTKRLIIHVIDTGIGMKSEDVKLAFEKFRQVDDQKNRQQEGTGLGLSISKSLVELHGGEVKISSVFGKGTKISLIFPPSIIYDENEDDNNAKCA